MSPARRVVILYVLSVIRGGVSMKAVNKKRFISPKDNFECTSDILSLRPRLESTVVCAVALTLRLGATPLYPTFV